MSTNPFYTLRQVADLTGLSEFTLRGWEGRYSALTPSRTETGRRRYTRIDLKRALLLRELTHSGHRIGEIAQLTNSVLEKKINQHPVDSLKQNLKSDGSSHQVENVMKLVLLQDWGLLKKTLHDLTQSYVRKKKVSAAVQEVILPILSQLGMYVATQRIGIAQEHILSAVIKEQLYFLLSQTSNEQKKVKTISIVIAAPEGDYHELGILVAHVLLNANGVNSLFLGANTPKNDLCETVIRFDATHILLASTITRKEGAKDDLFGYVNYVDQHVPESVTLWAGGRSFEKLNFRLKRKLTLLKTLQEVPGSVQQYLK